ncbi:putative transcriptional regulator tpeD [Wolffia australiana]
MGFKIMGKYATETTFDPPGSKAIKDVTHKLYGNMKGKLVHLLANVPKVNNRWELRQYVLAIRELVGKHNDENMSAIVIQVLEDFGLKMKVGSITTDNASSNEQMVALLAKKLKPIDNRFTNQHVPCAAHMLNIIV